jgi:twitching motility protein PilI
MQTPDTVLREYQRQLLDRIHAIGGTEPSSSHLGFEAGEQENWVVPLTDVSEVIPLPIVVPVPLTADWFTGVANIRGSLFAITDFAQFSNGNPTPIEAESRLVLLHARFRVHAALLIRRSLGLKKIESIALPDVSSSSWLSGTHTDSHGRIWRELNVQQLTRDTRFLKVGC